MFGMMIDTGPKFYTVSSQPLKFLGPHYLTLYWISFMFGMMIDIGP